jgi:alpha-beta hydrolase superfamily lysophospholipase
MDARMLSDDPTPPEKPMKSLAPLAGLISVFLPVVLVPMAVLADTPRAEVPLQLPTYQVRADDQFQWIIPIKVYNFTRGGIYTDSVRFEVEDLDAGELRQSRHSSYTMTSVATLLPSISSGDSGVFRLETKASAEKARVTVHLYSHGGDGTPHESTGDLAVEPGIMSTQFPSRFIERDKRKIEYALVPEVWPPKASPGLLVVHGEGSHARRMLPAAWYLANRGYAVLVMSLPGYGLSSGPPDLAGPRAVQAVEAALDVLRRSPGVDSTRIAMWGISSGATAVLQAAALRHDVKVVAAQSGLYDLAAVARTTTSEDMRRMIREEAGPEGGWKRRSPMASIRNLKAPILLLHGEADTVAPVSQVSEFATALRAAGGDVTLKLLPQQAHVLQATAARDTVDDFLESYLAPVRKGRR